MKNGAYILVRVPVDYPGRIYRTKYCYEHHLVWWQNTGEILQPGEIIHHKDQVKTNNNFSNLIKLSDAAHKTHHSKPIAWLELNCFWCKKPFDIRQKDVKSRQREYGHANICCSRSCQIKKQHSDAGREVNP